MKKFFLMISVFLGLMAFVLPAQATSLTFELGYEFSGAYEPEGTAPWITATFDDSFGDDNTVRLTMSANNLVYDEFIDNWLFNFDPDFDLFYPGTEVPFLTFTAIVLDGSMPDSTPDSITTGVNFYKADGNGYYDIRFEFPVDQSTNRFTEGEAVVYDITYISPIDVNSFNFGSALGGGSGTHYSAAHIQGIGDNDEYSGWIAPVPEPSTMLLLGFGLVGLAAVGRKRFHTS